MIDLTNTTFIIPIKIDHQDRYNNAKQTLFFLANNLSTNIYIYEVSDDGQSKLDFLPDIIKDFENIKFKLINEKSNSYFHRTKYLNVLLNMVKTPVVVNYDIDVILEPETYKLAESLIIDEKYDLIYPYGNGRFQYMVNTNFDRELFFNDLTRINIQSEYLTKYFSVYGHCQFFNTDIYRKFGGENEDFISWGPEDQERLYRFQKLGCKINWLDGKYVYHFEHYRGDDSGQSNPFFQKNINLFNTMASLSSEQLYNQQINKGIDYFNNPENKINIKKENIDFYYINLDSRVDKKNNTEAELLRSNLEAQRFSACTPNEIYGSWNIKHNVPGQRGCFLSHIKLISEYKNYDKILGILEDDVIFCDDWDERLEYIENNFNLDWDIFYFTSFFHLNHDPKRWKNVEFEFTDIKYITKVYSSFCTHAYLINPKSIPKILDLCQKYQNEAFAIDHLYLLIQPELNCYSFTPGMATQRPGNNDIDLIYKDQSVFKQIVGDHYYCNKLSDFDYEIFYKKNI